MTDELIFAPLLIYAIFVITSKPRRRRPTITGTPITTGQHNVAVGNLAARNLTAGSENVSVPTGEPK